jgi:hypothetical protein
MNKIKTMALLGILVASYFTAAGLVVAQAPGDPFIQVTQVLIDQFNETENSEQSSMWVFGPQPNIRIQYADNNSDISENNFRVEPGTEMLVNITIPQEFLGEGVNLEIVKFWGSAGELGTSRAIFLLQYNVSSDVWTAPVTVYYEPASDRPTLNRFLAFNRENSEFSMSESSYNIVWAINFTNKVLSGEFWTGMEAIDSLGRPVTPSWLARQTTGSFESPPIGLGVDINPAQFALPDYYYGEITDIDGNLNIHCEFIGERTVWRNSTSIFISNLGIPIHGDT